uniref:Si:dkey-174m14.3 n=1 Tax=Astyanax mexicanus TaxID=7994 RepID=A0A3B1J4X2_ASTMX
MLTSSFYTEIRRTSWSSTTTSSTSSSSVHPQPLHKGPAWPPVSFSSSSSASSSSVGSSSSWDTVGSDASSVQQLLPRDRKVEHSEDVQQHWPSYRTASCGSEGSSDQQGAALSWKQGQRGSVLGLTTGQELALMGGSLQRLELKIEAKLKFSQFLDEVSHQVLKPTSLTAFNCRRRSSSTDSTYVRLQAPRDQPENRSQQFSMQETVGKTYLETDIDSVFKGEELKEVKVKKETAITFESKDAKDGPASPEPSSGSYQSLRSFTKSTPRAVASPRSIHKPSDEEMKTISSLQEQKEDLRKRLSYTTHKLELLESEFDSTRQYLETELRRAQEELDKFTDKLRRIQSSYSALQRINQDLEDKIHRTSQHHDDEKRALSREIIVLNNHLMEAKMTIEKLREDNDLYRKDCNLAAQLLQCNKTHYRAQLSELPAEFQERLSLHMESSSLCHSPYSDTVSTSMIAQALEKPEEAEAGSIQASRSPSPQRHQPQGFLVGTGLGSSERLGLRAIYKSDLYSSDTALYCPDERRRERRPSMDLHGQQKLYGPQNSTDSTPEEGEGSLSLQQGFTQERFSKFATSLGGASSSYSSFSGGGSEDKGPDPPSSAGSSPRHHAHVYMDWRDGATEYEHKSDSSWERDSPSAFSSKAHGFQAAEPSHHQNGSSPIYSRTMSSCYSEPYEPLPPSTSPSVTYGDSRRGSALLAPEEEMEEEELIVGRWRQLSVEDVSAHSYRSPGRASPYSFSEQHFSVRPAKIRLGPLYSSFQEGTDVYHHHSGVLDPFSSPSPECSPGIHQTHLYRAKEDSQESEHSLYSPKEQKSEYVEVSPNSSNESLQHASLEMPADLQHYQPDRHSASPQGTSPPPPQPPPQYQKFGTLGLSRKDSLTKAQLYGTLLN